jgi:hypothetical protein
VKELHLVHPIRTPKGEHLGNLREAADQRWERQPDGDYLATLKGDPSEYLIPASNVKFERRSKAAAKAK